MLACGDRPTVRCVTTLALALLLASPAGADARVTAPEPVSPRGMLVQQSDMAAGGERTVVLMAGYTGSAGARRWSLFARIHASRSSRLQRLAAGSVFDPRVGVGPDGTAVAAWSAGNEVRAAVARPGEPFGKVRRIGRGRTVRLGDIAVTASGRAVVAWRGSTVQAAIREPDGRFGPPQTLASSQHPPAVAVAPSQTVLVGWLSAPRPPLPGEPLTLDGNPRLFATTLAPGAAGFAPATQLAGPPAFISSPRAASGPGGAGLSWSETGSPPPRRLALLTPAGGFSPAQPVPTAQYVEEHGDTLALTLPSAGRIVATWQDVRTRSPENPTIVAARVMTSSGTPGGAAFGNERQLSASGWIAGAPAAAARSGQTVVAWSERRGRRRARLRVAVLPAQGTPTTVRTVSTATAVGTVHAAAGREQTALAWIERDGDARGRMFLARVVR